MLRHALNALMHLATVSDAHGRLVRMLPALPLRELCEPERNDSWAGVVELQHAICRLIELLAKSPDASLCGVVAAPLEQL